MAKIGTLLFDKRKPVQGVGTNDADYVVDSKRTKRDENGKIITLSRWTCPFYTVWNKMLERGYSEKLKLKQPSYRDTEVCEEWWLFSNFKTWMSTQPWEGKQLDKDILFPGNKIYSPDKCVFVPQAVNLFVVERGFHRGEWPIGVHFDKYTQRFKAECRNPFTDRTENLGRYDTPEEAHQAWLTRKLELAKLIANTLDDKRVADALVSRYENYIDRSISN